MRRSDWIAQQVACVIAFGIITVQIIRLFGSLSINSLWQDELFSMNLARMQAFWPMLRLAAADTHPPTFYALLWGWTKGVGYDEVAARILPTLASIALVAVLLFLPRPGTSLLPRAFIAALAVTSRYWLEHAGELRAYIITALLLAVAALSSSRLVQAEPRSPEERRWGWMTVASAALAAITHLFAIYAAIWICLALFVVRPDHRKWALAGLAGITLSGAIYLAQVLIFHDFDASELLFHPTPAFLIGQIEIGLRSGGLPALILPAAILAAVALSGIVQAHWREALSERSLIHDALLAAGSLFVTLAGLAVTLIVPSMNYRGPQVGLVLGWCGMIGLLDRALQRLPRFATLLCCASLCGTALWLASWQGLTPLPHRPDFRGLAREVSAMPECQGATIPVLRDLPESRRTDEPEEFGKLQQMLQERYGYYERPAHLHYVPLFLVKGRYHPDPAIRALFAARLSGSDPCRVLAVTGDVRGYEPQVLESAMRTAIQDAGGDGRRLNAVWLTYYRDTRPDLPARHIGAFRIAAQND